MRTEALERCQEAIGYRFRDTALLARALTHASVASDRLDSNERLEFLGDAILGMVVCQFLFESYPDELEGELTKIKSSVVSRKTCAAVSHNIGLVECLFLGKGMNPRGHLPDSLAAAVLESLIAAMYLDCRDLPRVSLFVLEMMNPYIQEAADSDHQRNFKSQLQQHAQKFFSSTPGYELLDEQGPDHNKCFEVCVAIGNRRFNSAWGPSKKDAEQKAAFNAAVELNLITEAEGEECAVEDDVPIGGA